MLPSLVLKKMVMGNFNAFQVDNRIADSIDFMVERVSVPHSIPAKTLENGK